MKSPGGAEKVPFFCVSRVAGVSTNGSAGSVDIGSKGLAFMMAATSAKRVVRASCLSTRTLSMFEGTWSSLQARWKLVPLSERICFTGPRMEMNHLRGERRLRSCDRLSGRCRLCLLKGEGATQLLASSFGTLDPWSL